MAMINMLKKATKTTEKSWLDSEKDKSQVSLMNWLIYICLFLKHSDFIILNNLIYFCEFKSNVTLDAPNTKMEMIAPHKQALPTPLMESNQCSHMDCDFLILLF